MTADESSGKIQFGCCVPSFPGDFSHREYPFESVVELLGDLVECPGRVQALLSVRSYERRSHRLLATLAQ